MNVKIFLNLSKNVPFSEGQFFCKFLLTCTNILKKILKDSFTQAGQFQVIIGNTVADFYKDFTAVSGIEGMSKDAAKAAAGANQNILQRGAAIAAEIFTPLIPAIITGVYVSETVSTHLIFSTTEQKLWSKQVNLQTPNDNHRLCDYFCQLRYLVWRM